VTWRIVQASSVGTSHSKIGQSCQDECFANTFFTPDGDEYFLGVVSDGAGSAAYGRIGAEVACSKSVEVIEEWVRKEESFSHCALDTVTEWVVAIRQHIFKTAQGKGLVPRDLACTLLGAVISTRVAAFFQIGDGAIVIAEGDGFYPIFWPDSGEYANMTHFTTDDDALEHLRTKLWLFSTPSLLPREVSMFSDGLQRLALVYESRTAYKPFFEPMFVTLRNADVAACDILSQELRRFLNSPKVNERTDDDKTLVLATRRHQL
jgi:hypothetical protein